MPLPDLPETAGFLPYSLAEVDSVVAAPRPIASSVIAPREDDEVQQVFHAGGGMMPSPSAETVSVSAEPTFQSAMKLLPDPTVLARRQQGDSLGGGLRGFG